MSTLYLVDNHTSKLDGFKIAWRLRHTPCVFAVDPDYASHPLYARILTLYGRLTGGHTMVPVSTEHPFGARRLIRALKSGENVVVFPQGTGLDNPFRPWQNGYKILLPYAKTVLELQV